jgi:NAD(P)H-hydrate repair Nnr-like enzyme with NAD(P)H-hydrate dehydratase domain
VSRPLLLALVALAAGAGIVESASADYKSHREVRREAIVAGAVRKEVATERAENRYRDCVRGSGYDQDCDRQRWEDEQQARKKGRRTAIIVGAQ